MTADEMRKLYSEVEGLIQASDLRKALEILRGLTAANIPEADRAMAHVNLALVYKKLAEPSRAIAHLDQASLFPRFDYRLFAQGQKAAYLGELGRVKEAIGCWRDLLKQDELTQHEKEMLEGNIRSLEAGSQPSSPGQAPPERQPLRLWDAAISLLRGGRPTEDDRR